MSVLKLIRIISIFFIWRIFNIYGNKISAYQIQAITLTKKIFISKNNYCGFMNMLNLIVRILIINIFE